jgi:pimeloyl-ACP methyl ester carboxylesterase
MVMLAETLVTVAADPHVELLTAQSAGSGDQAVLVIHGGPDWDHTYLREPLAEIGSQCRLIMPDLRGCGRSTGGLRIGQYTPDAAVADLLALLDSAGLGTADVLGFSYGGLLAQRLALTAPRRVRRLVIASSSIYPVPADAYAGWPERNARMAAAKHVWSRSALAGAELVRAAAVAQAPGDVWRPDRLDLYLRQLTRVHFTGEWIKPWRAGTLPPARPVSSAHRLAASGIPILLLHGAYDMTFPAALAERAQAEMRNARAVILTDAGHMTHVDQPERWLEALTTFLSN